MKPWSYVKGAYMSNPTMMGKIIDFYGMKSGVAFGSGVLQQRFHS